METITFLQNWSITPFIFVNVLCYVEPQNFQNITLEVPQNTSSLSLPIQNQKAKDLFVDQSIYCSMASRMVCINNDECGNVSTP